MATKEDYPLLCLTVSTTLRPKPLTMTPARQPLAALIEAAGGLSAASDPITPTNANGDEEEDEGVDITGLDEVNLLENLALGILAVYPSSILNYLTLARLCRADILWIPKPTFNPTRSFSPSKRVLPSSSLDDTSYSSIHHIHDN